MNKRTDLSNSPCLPDGEHAHASEVSVYQVLQNPEHGVDFYEGLPQRHQRPQFRMVKTSIGPMTPRVLCGDDLSGEIYECG
jgi:hypothetical protein